MPYAQSSKLQTVAMVLMGIGLTMMLFSAVLKGIDREIRRQEIASAAMCKNYGAAMNNWARQNNLQPLPCEE